jgi:excisionase family DNA binding protein
MKLPITPPQAAAKLGVATVTIYKWIESGKLRAQSSPTGYSKRLYIDPDDVDTKRIELEEATLRHRDDLPQKPQFESKWVETYREILNAAPPLYFAYRHGKATFEQMKAEAMKRFDQLR